MSTEITRSIFFPLEVMEREEQEVPAALLLDGLMKEEKTVEQEDKSVVDTTVETVDGERKEKTVEEEDESVVDASIGTVDAKMKDEAEKEAELDGGVEERQGERRRRMSLGAWESEVSAIHLTVTHTRHQSKLVLFLLSGQVCSVM